MERVRNTKLVKEGGRGTAAAAATTSTDTDSSSIVTKLRPLFWGGCENELKFLVIM